MRNDGLHADTLLSSLDDVLRALLREEFHRMEQRLAELAARLGAPVPASPTEFVSVRSAAQVVGVSPNTIRNWLRDGRLRPRRAGRLVRVSLLELKALLETQAPLAQGGSTPEQEAARILARRRK